MQILREIITITSMDERLELLIHCALESGKIQRRYFQKKFDIRYKGEINLVTDVDIACQTRIIELIRGRFPDDEIISEEKANRYDGDARRWIIDPLDGTTNYAHGYPFFCTSIAFEESGVVRAGVVYNPIFKELFTCRKGEGAYLNNKRISVSKIGTLKGALLSTGFPYDLPTTENNNINHFIKFLYKAQAIRRDGSAALNLSYVACGRFDGFWELRLNPWDIAAGCLMVEEAGGTISNFTGRQLNIYEDDIVASNGNIHAALLDVLREDT